MKARSPNLPIRVLLALVVVGITAVPAAAHHFLGLPHYKYSEEYPQIPYLEVMAQVGTTDLDFTYFPGTPRPGEAVRFKLYVRDRESGEPYREPLRVEVARKRFLRGAVPVMAPLEISTGSGPERNDYKFFLTFEQPEAYQVRVHFPGENGVEVIPFPVVIGETNDWPLIGGAVLLLLTAIVSVAVLKKLRRRSGSRAADSRADRPGDQRYKGTAPETVV